jgi:heme exporter protein D
MDFGPYAVFIVTAYAAAAVIVAGLVIWIMLDRRRLVRAMADVEAQGLSRRSGRKPQEKPRDKPEGNPEDKP